MRADPFSKNLPVPVLPDCCANTRGAAAMAVAAAPAFSILRLIGSIFGVLPTFGRLDRMAVTAFSAALSRRPPARAPQLWGACSAAGKSSSLAETDQRKRVDLPLVTSWIMRSV